MSAAASRRGRRSHPPSLPTLARRAILDHRLAARGDRVLVACSGGPDSMALLHVLASLRAELGIDVVAHGVDHGLRPAARDELDLARRVADGVAVPFDVTTLQVTPGGNVQARARRARQDALEAARERVGARRIATAHTADDRAETLLMRLVRGTGLAGLGVLPPSRGCLVRPLLEARRSDVLGYLERHAIPFAEDPSNRDPRFVRTRVRREVLPVLEAMSPRVVRAICALADAAAELEVDPLAGLGRAQRETLARALSEPRAETHLWLAGGREAVVTVRPARAASRESREDRVKKR
jgi:tRNA(Ile)-lysidine synthase